jgi:sRNA-binding protein
MQRAARQLKAIESREQRADSREQRAENREQRAESGERGAESRKQRAESREQRAESGKREHRAEKTVPMLSITTISVPDHVTGMANCRALNNRCSS